MTHPDTLQIPRAVVEQALEALDVCAVMSAMTKQKAAVDNQINAASHTLRAALQPQPTPPVLHSEEFVQWADSMSLDPDHEEFRWAKWAWKAASRVALQAQPTPPVGQAAGEPVEIRFRKHYPPGPDDGTRRLGDWQHAPFGSRDFESVKNRVTDADAVELLYTTPQPTPDAEAAMRAQEQEPSGYIIRHADRPHERGLSILADEVGSYQRKALLRQPLYAAPGASPQPSQARELSKPQWIVNDLGELGVRVGSRFFFLYKGDNIEYGEDDHKDGIALHDDGSQYKYRMVGKREFGEVCHPMKWVAAGRSQDRYTEELVFTPGLSFGKPEDGTWLPLPAAINAKGSAT